MLIPSYFQYKESPCISYSYTRSVASKILNYKASVQQRDFKCLSQDPPPCNCSYSQFLYAPCGHIVTGDLNIVLNNKLRDLLSKGPKYTRLIFMVPELWHYHECVWRVCQTVGKERRRRSWHSEWIKSTADVLKHKIRRLKHSVNTRQESFFSDPDVSENFPVSMRILS